MEHFPIYFRFRDKQRQAQVHKHTDHYGVWLTDTEILNDFCGLMVFDKNKKFKEMVKEPKAADLKGLQKAISEQLE